MYKSVTSQSLHYFSRPHEGILRFPLSTPAAWRGSDYTNREDWRDVLSLSDVGELDEAILVAKRSGKPTKRLRKADFPLPTLGRKIARWRETVASGRGFQVITGVPVDRWGPQDSELFFWCFGLHLGTPGAQNGQGDLLGHVRDTGESPKYVRHYRTRVNISFHCDAADVVGLLCLRRAKRGGASRIVSSVSIYNELLKRRPDLVDRLYAPFMLDTKGDGGVNFMPISPCTFADGTLRTFYHSDYFRSAADHPGSPPLPPADRELLDLYNDIADTPGLYFDMDFNPGDIQLLSNHTVLHARTAYEDYPEDERKRHLLRLWLSLPTQASLSTRVRAGRSRMRAIAMAIRYKLRHRLWRAGIMTPHR